MHINGVIADAGGHERFSPYLARYRAGEWRAPIWRDLIADDARSIGPNCTILDIGCGNGFDGELSFQKFLAALSGRFIGVEPDAAVQIGAHFGEVHRCLFEDADIEPESIDLAFAVMVLEHLENPQTFWDSVHAVLKPGGVFWGFTVDKRSLFAIASKLSEQLRIKDAYMTALIGKRGEERYLNYPTFYRSNTPQQLAAYTKDFNCTEFINFARIGQHRWAVPKVMRAMADQYDSWVVQSHRPGTLCAVRARK